MSHGHRFCRAGSNGSFGALPWNLDDQAVAVAEEREDLSTDPQARTAEHGAAFDERVIGKPAGQSLEQDKVLIAV
jgi:hypothetical protein